MAFLGSIGKALGISTGEAANIATSFATGGLGQAALTTLGSLGERDAPRRVAADEATSRPAGIDSPATVSQVSQTSQIMPPMPTGRAEGFQGPFMPPQQAFIGGPLVPGIIGGAARLLSKPGVGGALTGIGTGIASSMFVDQFGREKKLVITRKLQRDTKKLFMMTGGNLRVVSQQSNFFLGKPLSEEQILMILFKTFKNQGPYVTKAAVRKTRQTIRKMETLCDLKDRLAPPKRRAPARRRTMSTSITQVK